MRCKHCYEPMKMYWIGIKRGNLTVTYICQNSMCDYVIEKQKERDRMIKERDKQLKSEKKVMFNRLKGGKT